EKLALVDTAQRELKKKVDTLKDASSAADDIAAKTEAVQQNHESAAATLKEITTTQTKANEILETIKQDEEAVSKLKEDAGEIEKRNASLAKKLEGDSEILSKLHEETKRQSDLITNLLPEGASAGLASSFGARVRRLEGAKWMWMAIFILTVLLLAGFAWQIVQIPQANTEQIWTHVLHRLPL